MEWKNHTRLGLKAGAAMGAINFLILGLMMLIGYDTTPLTRSGIEIPIPVFVISTIIGGGIAPGIIGLVVWKRIDQRWNEHSRMVFTLLALLIATFRTLPYTNPNIPTGDAYVLTSVLHYTTAILGSWFIPFFANAPKIFHANESEVTRQTAAVY